MSQGIKCGKCKGYHESVAAVRVCSLGGNVTVATINPDPATAPQIKYLTDLVNAREIPETPEAVSWFDHLSATIAEEKLSKREASFAINRLKGFPFRAKVAEAKTAKALKDYATVYADGMDETERVLAPKATRVTEDGMYRNPNTGEIFKVQFNKAQGSGRSLYAKQLVLSRWKDDDEGGRQIELKAIPLNGAAGPDGDWQAEFRYVSGAIRSIHPDWRMTMEDAKKFGALYGTCVRCGKTLTLEESIERGMGRTCAGKI